MTTNYDSQVLINKLIGLGYLDANVKIWGRQSIAALRAFKHDNSIESDTCNQLLDRVPANIKAADIFTENIINEMKIQGFFVSRGECRNNIIYIRNCGINGFLKNETPYDYSDIRLILIVQHSGFAYIKKIWTCVIDSDERLSKYKPHGESFKVVTPQQTWGWVLGKNTVEEIYQDGLVQVRPIAIIKTFNDEQHLEDFKTLGINQYGARPGRVGKLYAEPLACSGIEKQKEFVDILRADARYLVNKNYIFVSTFLDGYKCSILE
jgi:hypothetical protein